MIVRAGRSSFHFILVFSAAVVLAHETCSGDSCTTAAEDDVLSTTRVLVQNMIKEETIVGDSALQLLQKQASRLQGKRRAEKGAEKHAEKSMTGMYPAGWFGSFSIDESTYSYDGTFAHRNENPAINVMDGWNPQQKDPYVDRAVPEQWFEESKSGGYKEAWQTFYPAVPRDAAGNGETTGTWYTGTGGVWQQDYRSPDADGLSASWFDDSVNQIDGYGRMKFPALGSPRNFLYWEERSVNTTLTCKDPGCIARVSLQAPFDFNKEISKDCRLSVMFHPTDFDDQYSGEEVEYVQVNDRLVGSGCHPYSNGCNKSASRPLLPCVDAVPIDLLMPKNGVLRVSAKIPKVVDECPHNGNLLSAVPMVTCLVAPKSMVLAEGEVSPAAKKPIDSFISMDTCSMSMPLQCPTRGCAAEIAIPVNSSCASGKRCSLSIRVNQTDFDNLEITPEVIDYIKVQGKSVASNLKPGQNPCKSEWHGSAVPTSALTYTAIKDYDVTPHIADGMLHIEAKISQYVDECASNGYLLDALASVTCS